VYRELVHLHPDLRTKPSVAVISPYKAQVSSSGSPTGVLPEPTL